MLAAPGHEVMNGQRIKRQIRAANSNELTAYNALSGSFRLCTMHGARPQGRGDISNKKIPLWIHSKTDTQLYYISTDYVH